jgi:hypothetical protein
MLTESHTKTEKLKIFRNSYFQGVLNHRSHHSNPENGSYQQFFGYLDDLHSKFTKNKNLTKVGCNKIIRQKQRQKPQSLLSLMKINIL